MESYEFLRKNGYQEEAILLELYASGEACEIVRRMADVGLFRQTTFHSQTSQYGTLSRAPHALPEGFSIRMANALNAIRSGEFSGEWEAERLAGYPEFGRLKSEALAHHINEVEDRLHKLVRADSEV
jgi:ketol-acid reductoisomerase